MRWTDLDAYRHVNNAAMLTLLEEARIAALWRDGSSSDGSTAAIGSAAAQVRSGGPARDTRTLVARQEIGDLAPLDNSHKPVDEELGSGRIGGASLLIC